MEDVAAQLLGVGRSVDAIGDDVSVDILGARTVISDDSSIDSIYEMRESIEKLYGLDTSDPSIFCRSVLLDVSSD